jgi:hypothetical protein
VSRRPNLEGAAYYAGPLGVIRASRAWLAGGSDSRHQVLGSVADEVFANVDPTSDRAAIDTFWLAGNREAGRQAMEQDFRRIAAGVADETHELRTLVGTRTALLDRRDMLDAAHERLVRRERPTLATVVAGPAEKNAAPGVVLARREREWGAPIRALATQRAQIDAELDRIQPRIADLAGYLVTVFDVTVRRSRTIRHHYERCAEIYRRRFSHRAGRGHDVQAVSMWTTTIPEPAWNTEACPWIPRSGQPSAANRPEESIRNA